MTSVIDIQVITYFDFICNCEFEKTFRESFPYLRIRVMDIAKTSTYNHFPVESLEIDGNITCKELVNKMYAHFGKKVVVQRYTLKGWVNITKTRYWTLIAQNEEAKALAALMG
jgi:hypothetical protein